jgi:Carboxypeptidase regulatory-like domain
MRQKRAFAVGSWILVWGAALAFAIGTAWGESGIRVSDGDPEQITEGNPPCNANRVTTYRVTLKNVNGPLLFGSEDANPVRQANRLELGLQDDQEANVKPRGSLKFLGFKTSGDGDPDDDQDRLELINIETGDENTVTFFFDVETGPADVPLLGKCDFEFAEFGLTVCDTGGSCDFAFWTDPPDPICESPKHVLTVRLEADPSFCPASATGTAAIQGTVSDAEGQPAGAARVQVTRGCRGSTGFVNQDTRTERLPPEQRGRYAISGLPFPATYTVEARADGLCATAEVTIPAAGGTVTQNMTLTASCP